MQWFDAVAQDLAVDGKILAFTLFNSMKPSLALFSRKAAEFLDRESEWDRGYCPVCGSMPGLTFFQDNGKRHLTCSFCEHAWQSKRVYCPFCENTDHESLHYYEIENEEEYRVDVCEKCKKFIKTVDTKKTTRPLYFPLESISTPYIDVKFNEMGYSSGNIPFDK